MASVKVRNNSGRDIYGRHNGVDYHIPDGQATPIPESAARHILGYGEVDKEPAFHRIGWVYPGGMTAHEASKLLEKVSFSEATEVYADEIDHLPTLDGGDAAGESTDSPASVPKGRATRSAASQAL